MKKLLVVVFLFMAFISYSQIDANSLMGLPQATDLTEIQGIANPQIGSIVYNLDDDNIYRYTGSTTGWRKGLGELAVYTGFFEISSTDNGNTVNVTGLPFEPTNITFVAHANVESFGLNNDNQTRDNDRGIRNSFGTMNGYARNDGTSIEQGVIYVGSNGNSINDISRYSSTTNVIGVRYGDQNGLLLGNILGELTQFTSDGFSIDVTYINGTQTNTTYDANPDHHVLPADILDEGLIVLYTAYK